MMFRLSLFSILLITCIKGVAQYPVSYIAYNDFFSAVPVYENNQEVLFWNDNIGTNDIDGHLSIGYQALLNNDFTEALLNFDKAVKASPNNATAYYYRGFAYSYLEEVDSAIADLQKSLEIDYFLLESRIELGNLFMLSGNTSEARKHFNVVKEIMFNNPISYYYLGRLEFLEHLTNYNQWDITKHIRLSKEYLKKAIKIDQSFAPAYLQLAMLFVYQAKPSQAINYYSKAVRYDSLMEEAYLGLGYAHLMKGNKRECHKMWSILTTLDPDNLYYKALLSFINIERENFDEAIMRIIEILDNSELKTIAEESDDTILKRIRVFVNTAETYIEKRNSFNKDEILVLDKALCYLLYDDIDRAIIELTNVSEELKNNEIYYLFLATAYEYSNKLDSAYNNFERVHVYDSTLVEPYLKKGLIHYLKGNNQNALNELNQMISLDTSSVSGYSFRALVYASLGQFEEAITDYSTFLEADSTQSNIYYGRGYCKERLADYDGAHNDYLIALSKRNTLTNSLYNNIMNGEARIALFKKDTVFALEIVDDIINNDKDNDEARVIKSNILINRKDYDEALNQLNQAINSGKVTVKIVMMRAKLLTSIESFDKAIVDLNAIIEVQPENAEALFYRAIAYAKTDDEDKAKTDLEKSKSLNFDTKSWSLPFEKPQIFLEEENKE